MRCLPLQSWEAQHSVNHQVSQWLYSLYPTWNDVGYKCSISRSPDNLLSPEWSKSVVSPCSDHLQEHTALEVLCTVCPAPQEMPEVPWYFRAAKVKHLDLKIVSCHGFMLIQDTRQLLALSCNLSTACSSYIQQTASIKGIPWKVLLDSGRVIDETIILSWLEEGQHLYVSIRKKKYKGNNS